MYQLNKKNLKIEMLLAKVKTKDKQNKFQSITDVRNLAVLKICYDIYGVFVCLCTKTRTLLADGTI